MVNKIHYMRLKYAYESAKGRMEAHPEAAAKYQAIIAKQHFFNSEKEALQYAIDKIKSEGDPYYKYQIWAKVEPDEETYRFQQNGWLVTNDWKVKQAAEYIGMALMYDETRLNRIISEDVKIDDVVAYR